LPHTKLIKTCRILDNFFLWSGDVIGTSVTSLLLYSDVYPWRISIRRLRAAGHAVTIWGSRSMIGNDRHMVKLRVQQGKAERSNCVSHSRRQRRHDGPSGIVDFFIMRLCKIAVRLMHNLSSSVIRICSILRRRLRLLLNGGVNGSVTLGDELTQRGRYPGGRKSPSEVQGRRQTGGLVDKPPS